jgi:hypothetical protein
VLRLVLGALDSIDEGKDQGEADVSVRSSKTSKTTKRSASKGSKAAPKDLCGQVSLREGAEEGVSGVWQSCGKDTIRIDWVSDSVVSDKGAEGLLHVALLTGCDDEMLTEA